MKANKLQLGDTIGIITPSRPIYTRKAEFDNGVKILQKLGYKVKLGKNIEKHDYYSAGTDQERVNDLHEMFADPEVKAIICATGGITSNQLLPLIDFDLIKNNPKIFVGYSDITTLLLAIYEKTGLVTFHGPDVCELPNISPEVRKFYFDLLSNPQDSLVYPDKIQVIKPGKATGKLIGGYLVAQNSLLGTQFSPNYDSSIWFWEITGESPALIHHRLMQFKLSGNMNNIAAMVIGHLDDCADKKYPQDNRSIDEIVSEVASDFNFPIFRANFFGHELSNFLIMPIGCDTKIGSDGVFSLLEPCIK